MFNTKRLYEENPHLLTCTASALDVMNENGETVVILDQTVFQPQKAGTETGVGLIESETKRFHVNRVERLEDYIRHLGVFESEPFEVDEVVTCIINEEFRKEIDENRVD
ncbi:hypothetical protein HY623_02360 [Candidatus Uhrbacteria bacterium]|nr:hypothetical protein [Candidatus Uhrbacteria bacterium]